MDILKLYIPTSTLNFNNIFSSESISPASFYSKRKFGYRRFSSVSPNPFDNSILLYNKIPIFDINDSENDNYKLIIEIDISLIPEGVKLAYEKDELAIFQLNKTIYLNPYLVKVYFFSENEKQTTIIKSKSSIETKLVNLYTNCFRIALPEEHNSFKWTSDALKEIHDFEDTKNIDEINYDQLIDKLKGFLYGYLIGAKKSLSPEFIELKSTFREIKNLISGLINLISNYVEVDLNTSHRKKPSKVISEIPQVRLSELSQQVKRFNFFYDKALNIEKPDIESIIKEKYLSKEFDNNTANKIIELFKSIDIEKRTIYEHIEYKIKDEPKYKDSNSIPYQLSYLYSKINGLITQPESSKNSNIILNQISSKVETIENDLGIIEENYSRNQSNLDITRFIEIENIKIANINDPFFERKNLSFFHELVNSLILYPIENTEQFKQERTKLAIIGGKLIQSFIDDWEKSDERRYINNLLDNIESYSPFELNSHRSKTLQSFAAFIMKGEDPDTLMDFLISNKVNDFRVALSLWGSVFGFAKIPRTLSDSFFYESDLNYVNSTYKWISKQLFKTTYNESQIIDIQYQQESRPQIEKQKDSYINSEAKHNPELDIDFNETLLNKLLTKIKLNKTQTKILVDNFKYVQAYSNPRTTRKEFLISLLWKKYWGDMKKRKTESKKISDKWINDIEAILKSKG